MKVLVLAQYFPPDIGGASSRASIVSKGLLNKGCDLTVVTAFPHYPYGKIPGQYKRKALSSERFYNSKVFRVWIPALPHNCLINRVILHCCFVFASLFAIPFIGETDVVWAANPNLFSILPAVVYSFVKRKPIVRNVDDLWPEDFYDLGLVRSRMIKYLLDLLAWFSYTIPSAITPISYGYKRKIIKNYNINEDKIHVIEVGTDKLNSLNAKNDSDKKFTVMYSGTLGTTYDFDIVLKAADELKKRTDIVFFIRGVGELSACLEKIITSSQLTNVILDAHFLPKDELSNLLSQADVFILPMNSMPSTEDGLPTKLFEYQSYGKPIICISNGEPARYVKATKSGIIVRPNNEKNLIEAVIRLHDNRGLASELGLNGWLYVSKNMMTNQIGARMYEVFVSVTH